MAEPPGPDHLPRVIWILWLQGRSNAPALVDACIASWIRHNPDWDVRVLDSHTLETFVDLPADYGARNWRTLPAPAFSDLVRLSLLREHGGVWADATTYCMRPLRSWLPGLVEEGFFAFSRPFPDREVATWFLAATHHHPIVERWSSLSASYWHDRAEYDTYFWLHERFSELAQEQSAAADAWRRVPTVYPSGPHRFLPYEERLARPPTLADRVRLFVRRDPLYKLTHRVASPTWPKHSVARYFIGRERPL